MKKIYRCDILQSFINSTCFFTMNANILLPKTVQCLLGLLLLTTSSFAAETPAPAAQIPPASSEIKKPVVATVTKTPATIVQAKTEPTVSIPLEAATVEAFVPKGWKIEQKIEAKLTNDNTPDTILELREQKATTAEADIDRKLLILIKTPQKTFHRAALGEKLLLCPNCFGTLAAAEDGGNANFKVDKGVLIIEQLSGSRETEDRIQRFRYEAKSQRFRLIGEDRILQDRATGDASSKSSNYLTAEEINEVLKQGKIVSTKKTKITVTVKYLEDVDNNQ
jgi:hypothetical protein